MLEEQRKKIDNIDKELVKLFEQRMDLVTQIAQIKKANNLDVFDENREKIVIEKVQSLLKNPAYQKPVREFFLNLMQTTKDFQKTIINN